MAIPQDAISAARKNNHRAIDEATGKKLLHYFGISVPKSIVTKNSNTVANDIMDLNFPVAVKVISQDILHKSDSGGVKVGLGNINDVKDAIIKMSTSSKIQAANVEGYIVEEMAPTPIAEMFLSLRNDKKFGKVLTIGMGGSLTELYNDATTFILPLSRKQLLEGISKLKMFKLINGFRNKEKINKNKILKDIFQLINIFEDKEKKCSYLEINPLFIYKESVVVIDCILSTQE